MAVTLQQCLGVTPDKAHYLPSAILPSNNLVGIEVELENIPRAAETLDYWRVTRDGSLRDNGIEFILAHPTCGQTLIDALSELGAYLEHTKAKASDRTSVHVHLDFRSNTVSQTFQFLMMYAIIERTLIKYAGGEARANSIYCIPLYKSFETIREWGSLNEKAIKGNTNVQHACQYSVRSAEKYAACNIKPLGNFGSIEIRIHKGCKDMDRILEWVQILLALKLYTDTVQIDFDDMFNVMSQDGYEGIIPAIFGAGIQCDLLCTQGNLNDDLGRGMRVAQDILHQWTMQHRKQMFPTADHFHGEGGHPLLQKKLQRSKPTRGKTQYYHDLEAGEPTVNPTATRDRTAAEILEQSRLRRGANRDWTATPYSTTPAPAPEAEAVGGLNGRLPTLEELLEANEEPEEDE